MILILILVLLAGLAGLTYVYRDKVENFLPGFKTYAWHGLVFAVSFGDLAVQFVNQYSPMLGERGAALGMVAGFVGILLSWVTKRYDRNGDGKVSDEDR